jgi:hypothetical protein
MDDEVVGYAGGGRCGVCGGVILSDGVLTDPLGWVHRVCADALAERAATTDL